MDIDHKALFESMPVPRFIVTLRPEDGAFVVKDVNRRAQEYFNRKREQIVGNRVEDFMDSENARHFHQAFEVCGKQKMPVTIQALPNFPGGIRVHGFWINPLIDITGRVVMIDVMAQPDALDDSILQRERDDAISLLTSIFDVSEIGIIVTDPGRRIVRVNDSFVRTYGWSREDIVGEEFSFLLAGGEQGQGQSQGQMNLDQFLKSGIRSSGEVKIARKDGSIANALFTTAVLELSQRRRFQVTTIMDITLRKQMEVSLRMAKDQADAANHAKSSFLANMSHELRTPLNAIIGFSEMMMKETFGPLGNTKYQEYLEDIHLSARHLLEIINEVLDMSKIEAGRVDLDEAEIDIEELADSVTRIVASRTFSQDVKIHLDIAENLPRLHADPRLIRQVLINLVGNAVKFSNKGGEVKILSRLCEDGDLELVVEDNGIGIPADKISEALEPFGQIHDSSHAGRDGYHGTGLGLPLARAMVELHGGSLKLDSEAGKGTRVTIQFPARRTRRASGSTASRNSSSASGLALARPGE